MLDCSNILLLMPERMDPETLEVVADEGATLESLRVTKTNLNHLPNTPHKTALKYLWDKQEANKR